MTVVPSQAKPRQAQGKAKPSQTYSNSLRKALSLMPMPCVPANACAHAHAQAGARALFARLQDLKDSHEWQSDVLYAYFITKDMLSIALHLRGDVFQLQFTIQRVPFQFTIHT